MLGVVTFLWSDPKCRWNGLFKYGPEHVDKLARGVRRNLSLPHEFILVTDQDPRLFAEPDYVVPLWDDFKDAGGCYRRLKTFAPEMRTLLADRFVCLDLDTVIVGPLDSLLDRDEDFVIWKNAMPYIPYCASMYMMNAGARKEVWEDFDPREFPGGIWKFLDSTDQAWISHRLGPGEATWVAGDGVLNYRWQIGRFHGGRLPRNARIVFFTGPVDPSLDRVQGASPWIKEHWV